MHLIAGRLLALAWLLAALPGVAMPGIAMAEEAYPSRPIRLIALSAAGGGVDTTVRLMAGPMGQLLGRPVVVENRPSGPSGGQVAATARPDGYTFAADASAFAVRHRLHANLSFDYVRDFTPVARLSIMPLLLVVPAAEGAADLRAFIDSLRRRAEPPHYAAASVGSASHFAGLLFTQQAGLAAQSVNYRGGSPAALAVLTGDAAFNFATMPSALGMVQGNRLRALAVSSEARSSLLPEVPTVAEAALPGFGLYEWIGLYAPTGTPQPILERVAAAARQALEEPDVRSRLALQGAEPAFLGLDRFPAFLNQQRALLGGLADAAGMRAE